MYVSYQSLFNDLPSPHIESIEPMGEPGHDPLVRILVFQIPEFPDLLRVGYNGFFTEDMEPALQGLSDQMKMGGIYGLASGCRSSRV